MNDPMNSETIPGDARQFLQSYVFELFEKIVLFSQYVNSWEHLRARRKEPIVKYFSSGLDSLVAELDVKVIPSLRATVYANRRLTDRETVKGLIIRIESVVKRLKRLHHELYLMNGTGRSENEIVYDFIRKIDADSHSELDKDWMPWKWFRVVPPVAISDEYEAFVMGSLDPLLHQHAFIALPKIEVDNPLTWVLLTHEIAHIILERHDILKLIRNHYRKLHPTEPQLDQFNEWVLEFAADLIGLYFLGPVYYCAQSSLGLLIGGDSFQRPVELYPSMSHRLTFLRTVVGSLSSQDDSPWNHYKHLIEPTLKFLHDNIVYKIVFASGVLPNKDEPIWGDIILSYEPFKDALDKLRLPPIETYMSEQLIADLRNNRPIVSKVPEYDRQELATRLAAAKDAKSFYSVLDGLAPDEKPLRLSTILMSGWILKIQYDYKEFLEQLEQYKSLAKIQEWYNSVVARRNRLMQISISSAYMTQMYQRASIPEERDGK